MLHVSLASKLCWHNWARPTQDFILQWHPHHTWNLNWNLNIRPFYTTMRIEPNPELVRADLDQSGLGRFYTRLFWLESNRFRNVIHQYIHTWRTCYTPVFAWYYNGLCRISGTVTLSFRLHEGPCQKVETGDYAKRSSERKNKTKQNTK